MRHLAGLTRGKSRWLGGLCGAGAQPNPPPPSTRTPALAHRCAPRD